jgi:pimeloyl-ACP methyl ester carboxylesterase
MSQPFVEWPRPGAPVSVRTWWRDIGCAARAALSPPPYPGDAARGNGQSVLVLPGFGAPDATTRRLRGFLVRQGFDARPWGCGVNLGPVPGLLARLEQRVMDAAGDGPVALVGVSLGGTFAREMARRLPGKVSRIVTLGTPVRLPVVSPLAPVAWAARRLWDAEGFATVARIGEAVPVPLTAIVSPVDGVLDWRGCLPEPSDTVEIVEIAGAHSAMGSDPRVQRIVADRLARTAG